MARFRLVLTLCALVAALACAGGASAYPWPVRPFDKQHAVRGNFGDPRTVFLLSTIAGGFDGPGSFSFHNGIDISAAGGTAVYPVASGVAKILGVSSVAVTTPSGVRFHYEHIEPDVMDGQRVVARKTVLGRVQAVAGHVHLTEFRGTRVVNPLQRGHIAPYRDRTAPRVASILVRDEAGKGVGPLAVCGRITLAAEAYDTPPVPVPGSFSGFPVAPALITWKITKLNGSIVLPRTSAADFRRFVPLNEDFWNVYARGTYQNAPRFGLQQFNGIPGRYLYWLTQSLDTRLLGNGVFVITADATDTRGNRGALSERISVLNRSGGTGCPEPPPQQKKRQR